MEDVFRFKEICFDAQESLAVCGSKRGPHPSLILPSLRDPHPQPPERPPAVTLSSLPETDASSHMAFPNPEQREAIVAILSRTSPLPYVIFGPPGTGKTSTLVQAIVEVCIEGGADRLL